MLLRSLTRGATLTLLILTVSYSNGVYSQAPGVAQKQAYFADIVSQLEIEWPKNRTLNMVFHGHSVPTGYTDTPIVDTFNAYPHLLHRALKKKYPHAVINAISTGIGGETSSAGQARFQRDVLTHRPDIVAIDYGLSDTIIGLEQSAKYMGLMIEAAKAKGAKVILLTLTPDTRADLNDPADRFQQMSAQIRRLAARHQVAIVDSHAAFKRYVDEGGKLEDLMATVNHPNRRGHELVAQELLKWF